MNVNMNTGGFRSADTLHGTTSMRRGTSESSRGDTRRSRAGSLSLSLSSSSSSAAAPVRSETPVPVPNVPMMLGTLAPGRKRSDYQETAPVVHDGASIGGGGRGGRSTSTTPASGTTSRLGQRTVALMKETPVPLPPRIPQQQAVQVTPLKLAVSPAQLPEGNTTTTTTDTPRQSTGGASRRGRPRGWRPGMSYAAVRGHARPAAASVTTTTRPGPGAGAKRRGRPPKQTSPPPVDIYLGEEAPFIAFLCEWKGCPAELQNLETLRRHVRVVHLGGRRGGSGSECECRWGRCWRGTAPVTKDGERESTTVERDGGQGKRFDEMEELKAHVEGAHLVPFSWHVGDGPRNSSGTGKRRRRRRSDGTEGGDEVPDYLKDGDGNQVTPSIKGQQVEDYVTWRSNRKKLRELLLERDRNLPSEDDEDGLVREGEGGPP